MQFLDPTNDFAFKIIFGDDKKKHILISFLNSVLQLPAQQHIQDVVILNSHQVPRLKGAKESILDVRCYDQMGAEYIVEMQVIPQEFFDKRVLYYAAKAYSQQLDKGQEYNLLKPVIFLGILRFEFTQDPHYLSTHCIHNVETKEHVLRDFRFTFAELPKFNKTESELNTVEDKWLFFLKNARSLKAIPEVIVEQAIREAFEIVNAEYWDKDTLELYTMRNIYVQDEIHRVGYGYKKGRLEGRLEGQSETQHNIARSMLAKGMSLEVTAEFTGLPIDELKMLIA